MNELKSFYRATKIFLLNYVKLFRQTGMLTSFVEEMTSANGRSSKYPFQKLQILSWDHWECLMALIH